MEQALYQNDIEFKNVVVMWLFTEHDPFLTIFNEGAYLTFKSIFHKDLNLF